MAFRLLAAAVDSLHALGMLVWGLGLPLLVWHRFRWLSHVYMVYAFGFVLISVVSHLLLGECVLTTLARRFWLLGGGYRDGIPFSALLANAVAGLRPSQREVVLFWEGAILVTSLGGIWCWLRNRRDETRTGQQL
jgi:hypothetical protein